MELRQYFFLFRRWVWLLAIGLILGGLGAYYYSARQPQVFQTMTKVMVVSSPEDRSSGYSSSYELFQLAKTYTQLIVTEPVLQAASEALGFPVSGGQIRVREVPDSLLLEITVTDGDPSRAALIANTIIQAFIEYNESMQTSRFASSEESLQRQIDQVQSQIETIEMQMTQITEETLQTQMQQVEARIAELDAQIKPLEDEIEALLPPTPTTTPVAVAASGRVSRYATETPTTTPTATYTTAHIARIKAQQDLLKTQQGKLAELSSTRQLYQQVYMNLLVYGDSAQPGSSDGNRQDQLQGTLALYQQIYSNLVNSYENIRLARLRSTPNVVQIEPAHVPSSPVQPQPIRNAMLGAASGLLIMGAIAFLIEYLDDTLKTPEDVSQALGLTVIGLIGEMKRLKGKEARVYVTDNPRSPISEAFRTLRTNLEFAGIDKPLQTLLVTSAAPSEGKTTVAVNLAAIIAQSERKVVLVDADLRRPSIHNFFQLSNRSGLTGIFRNRTANPIIFEDSIDVVGNPPLKVITSGSLPPNPAELLGSERMSLILDTLKQYNDIVIIDGPPFILADPVVLSARVDGVLVVIEPGKTKIGAAQAMLEQLQRAGANVVGAVLNPISRKRAQYYYSGGYRQYNEYYYAHSKDFMGERSSSKNKNGSHPVEEVVHTWPYRGDKED